MPSSGQVFITITDGQGSVAVVPANSVQAAIGCSSIGTNFQIVATSNPATLTANQGYGPLVEAGALTILAGGLVLSVKVPLTTKGSATAVVPNAGNAGTTVMTKSLDGTLGAWDDYDVKVKCVTGGTIGTAGVFIAVSLDAGRNYGQSIALGNATTYAIANSGITLSFTVAAIVAGDSYTFGTTGPIWQDSDMQTGLNTLDGSQYGIFGWGGGTHFVGNGGGAVATTGGVPGADVTTLNGYLETLATNKNFTRGIASARDASPPAAYGGTAESETTWINSINADFSAVSAKRMMIGAGNWNMPSAFQNPSAGTPRPRRNVAWALAARTVAVPPQRHLGRVIDGALTQIAVDPINDPLDGFIYHNEFQNGGLDYKITGTGGRFATTLLRKRKPGVFNANPLMMAPFGSDFWMWPFGRVMDVACSILDQVGTDFINDDIRLNADGTIFDLEAKRIESAMSNAINAEMFAQGMISQTLAVVIDRTWNVRANSSVKWTATITGKGYILSESGTIGFANQNAA